MSNSITRTYPRAFRPRYYRETDIGGANQAWISGNNATWSDFKTSTANPQWRDQVRRHVSATTSREIDMTQFKRGYGDIYAECIRNVVGSKKNYHTTVIGPFVDAVRPSMPSSFVSADNAARMAFYKRLKDKQVAFTGLTFLGELRETLRMIRNPAMGLRRGLDRYMDTVKKRTKRTNKRNLNRIVAETWLEHAFGWTPLINDVKNAGEALNRDLDRYAVSYSRVSGTGREETSSFGNLTSNQGYGYYLKYTMIRHTETYVSVRYYGEVSSECDNPKPARLDLFGVSWREIVPTAWELVPYSFLVDYFTNVGDVLEAWSTRTSNVRWSARSVRMKAISSVTDWRPDWKYSESNIPGFKSWLVQKAQYSPSRCVRTTLDRQPQSVPRPSYRVEMPGFGRKWINMSALLATRNRTRRQMFR